MENDKEKDNLDSKNSTYESVPQPILEFFEAKLILYYFLCEISHTVLILATQSPFTSWSIYREQEKKDYHHIYKKHKKNAVFSLLFQISFSMCVYV